MPVNRKVIHLSGWSRGNERRYQRSVSKLWGEGREATECLITKSLDGFMRILTFILKDMETLGKT